MGKLIVDRDFLELPLTGMEFAAYLSIGDLGTIYRDKIALFDQTIYYNMADKFPNQKQREDLNAAIRKLIDEGYIVAEEVQRGLYLVDCQKSFHYDLAHLPHGGALIVFENIKKIVGNGKGWKDMLRYYLMVLAHQRKDKPCTFSRQYFSDKVGISELTLSKYNTALKSIGVLDIKRRTNMTSVYLTL